MRLRAPFHLLLVLLAVVLTAAPALAQDKATRAARKHWERGEKLFALGRFDEALVAYEQAFEAKPLPGFLFNIGQCHRNLGDLDAAIFSFRKYLKLSPDADNRDAVLELIDELEAEIEAREAAERDRALRQPPPGRDRERDGPSRGGALYTKWWFWGGVAAVAAGAGAGTYFLLRDDGVPDSDLGHVVFR